MAKTLASYKIDIEEIINELPINELLEEREAILIDYMNNWYECST